MEESRIARLRKACAQAGFDAFLVRDTSNIRWLTGFDGVFDDEDAHALLALPAAARLHTDSRYAEAARCAAQAAGGAVEVDDARVAHARFAAEGMAAFLKEAATDSGTAAAEAEAAPGAPAPADAAGAGGVDEPAPVAEAATLGIEDAIALREYRALSKELAKRAPRVSLRETDGFVQKLRAVKDAAEIARLQAAQAVADAAFAHITAFMRPGMTEREVQVELEDFMRRHGAEDVAFPSIVATGVNGASPHAVPGETRLEAGQCVVMDFGAKVQGYCSDMTRTVFLGEPSPRMRAAYETIRQANEQVEKLLAPGVTGKQAHELAEQVLAEAGFAGKMGHALGHGVGLGIHEEPLLAPRNPLPLEPGNVVTVEPGVYLPGEFGMRLEDFGVVTEDGFMVFTKSSHEMVIL